MSNYKILNSEYDFDSNITIVTVVGDMQGLLPEGTLKLYGYNFAGGFDGDEECSAPKDANIHTLFYEYLKIRLIDPSICVLPLTNEGLGDYGIMPLNLSGQTVSITGNGTDTYGMSSGMSGTPVNWTGRRLVGIPMDKVTGTTGLAFGQIARTSDQLNCGYRWYAATNIWEVGQADAMGNLIGALIIPGVISDVFAIAVDGVSGDVSIFRNGMQIVTKDTVPDMGTLSGLGGMFLGESAIIMTQIKDLANGDEFQAEVVTDYRKFRVMYTGDDLFDWCGNSMPVVTACTLKLSNDELINYGIKPMSLLGQIVSVTGNGVDVYGMADKLQGKPVDWVGRRLVGVPIDKVTGTTGVAYGQVARASDQDNCGYRWNAASNTWDLGHSTAASVMLGVISIPGSLNDVFAVAIDGVSGDVSIFKNGTLFVDKTTVPDAGTFAGLGGMFLGDNVIVMTQVRDLANGDEYQAEVVTDYRNYRVRYSITGSGRNEGLFDWCGHLMAPAV